MIVAFLFLKFILFSLVLFDVFMSLSFFDSQAALLSIKRFSNVANLKPYYVEQMLKRGVSILRFVTSQKNAATFHCFDDARDVSFQMGLLAHQQEIIEVTKKLLTAIVMADYDSYKEMSDPGLTSFEPESLGILVRSMEFHRFLLENALGFRHTIMIEPYVHMMGDDAACIAYVRLTQALGGDLAAIHTKVEETRIWHRRNGTWRHIHFHRSRPSTLHSK
uniref:Calcium/calmodulin-dependent protein kinase II association-domain domain-containing protein n=1 Tax=Hippocampus comes TaxID=109280 RepID=A0A3Q2YV15_HIPCM